MTEQNTEVKLIRLNTGEDIVGNCLFDDENDMLVIDSPMKVVVQRGVDYSKAMLLMLPWLPIEIVDENIITINYADVLTTINPKKSFIEFYFSTLERYEALVHNEENSLDGIFEDDDDEEDFDEESIDEMINAMKESKNKLIH